MSSHVILTDLIAAVLILGGGLLALAQKHKYVGDAPPVYYRRMIAGIMLAAFGLIVAVFATVYAIDTRV